MEKRQTKTEQIEQLVKDAKKAGMLVIEGTTRTTIFTGKTRKSVCIDIWEDGIATRGDVRLDLCLAIRSARQMREILGL